MALRPRYANGGIDLVPPVTAVRGYPVKRSRARARVYCTRDCTAHRFVPSPIPLLDTLSEIRAASCAGHCRRLQYEHVVRPVRTSVGCRCPVQCKRSRARARIRDRRPATAQTSRLPNRRANAVTRAHPKTAGPMKFSTGKHSYSLDRRRYVMIRPGPDLGTPVIVVGFRSRVRHVRRVPRTCSSLPYLGTSEFK